jgi:hypothetical protein
MKNTFKVVIFSLSLMLFGCGKTNESSKDTKTVEVPTTATQKEIVKINEDDAKLINHYGACGSILQAAIRLINQNGMKELLSSHAHQATIYMILARQIIEKYPESVHEDGYKIANQFLVENIIDKSFNGNQINEWKKQNGDCFLEEVPKDKVENIMNIDKERYDRTYKKNMSI